MRTLVIGYGNPLRRDDGAGPEAARRLAGMQPPGVVVVEAHQLLPEHAELLSRVRRAVFVDASAEEGLEEVRLQPVEPAAGAGLDPHVSDPGRLLALAAELFGNAPEAWMLRLPAADFGIGEGLSPTAEAAVREAVARLADFCAAAK